MVKKRLRTFLIAMLVCCLVGIFYYTQKPVALTIGVFAGSNWNVPSPDSGKSLIVRSNGLKKHIRMFK